MSRTERKGYNQKLKMLYLADIFLEETDGNHGLTMSEIIRKLALCGVNADRKTLYVDFEELRTYGMDIVSEHVGKLHYYSLASRTFELAELKLLVDAVQSAKFITDKKSKTLIRKLEALLSKYEGKQLQRQVVISGRIKTMNESVYYTVDKIHDAISQEKQIRFKYFQWNEKKEAELRRNGEWYQASPWALIWDNEYYYLVAYDSSDKKIKHYRVDKMLRISTIEADRDGKEEFENFDVSRYTKSLFGMYGGEEVRVTLEAENEMAGILIDRFGKNCMFIPIDDSHFKTTVTVAVSKQFLGWVMSLGSGIRIVSPDEVVNQMKEEIRRLSSQYDC